MAGLSGIPLLKACGLGGHRWLMVAMVLTVTAAAMSGHAVRDIKLRYDTLRYALVADQVVAGNGIRLSVLPHWQQHDPSGLTPFTIQPPGYPLALAALGSVRLDRIWPGQVINIIGHVVIVWCVWLITWRLAGFWIGAAAGLFAAICYPLLFVASMMLSEVMYIAMSMGCLLGVVMAQSSDRRGAWLVVAALAAAGAVATRLSGIALLPVLAWQVLVALRRGGWRAIFSSVAVLVAALVMLALLLARNWVYSGELRGFPVAAQDRSLQGAITGTLPVLSKLLSLNIASIKSLVLIIWVILTIVVFLGRKRSGGEAQVWRSGLNMVVLAAVSYYGFLLSAFMRYVPYFEPRYFVPLTPMLVIVLFVALAKGWGPLAVAGWPGAGKAALIGSILYCLAFGGYDTLARWPERARIPDKREIISRTMRVMAPLQDRLLPGERIASNREMEIAFATGRPTMRLPEVRPNFDWEWPEDYPRWLSDRMAGSGTRYLVLVAPVKGLDEYRWGRWLAALSQREDAEPPFTRTWQLPDGVIYELK